MQIHIGGTVHPVKLVSVNKTKVFGLVSKGIRTNLLQREVEQEGFLFEVIGVPISREELRVAAQQMVPAAKQIIPAAP